jgi:Cu/Ag efflux pump CusA
MIRSLVDHALNNRFVVLSLAALLFICGMIAFKSGDQLPQPEFDDMG